MIPRRRAALPAGSGCRQRKRAEGLRGGRAGRWPAAATGTGGGRGGVPRGAQPSPSCGSGGAGPRAGHGSTEACPGAAGAGNGRGPVVGLRLDPEPPTPARMLPNLEGAGLAPAGRRLFLWETLRPGPRCLPRGTLQGAAGSSHPVKNRGRLGGEEKGLEAAKF